MAKVYPYGFFFRSDTDLTDASGNYSGDSFKVPAFLDTVMLDSFAGNLIAGNFVLERNGSQRYSLELGIEREILVEPGDSFRLLIENGNSSNVFYNFQLGFRYTGRTDDLEVSDSSSLGGLFAEDAPVGEGDLEEYRYESTSSEFDLVATSLTRTDFNLEEVQFIDNLGKGTFGNSIDIYEDTMVVGNRASDEVYIYERDSGEWVFSEILKAKDTKRNDGFGYNILLRGNTLFVGAIYANIGKNKNQGAVYVFEKDGGSWKERQKIFSGDGGTGDLFGFSIDIYGNMMAVGAPHKTIGDNRYQGAVYLYKYSGSSWGLSDKLILGYGSGITDRYDKFGHAVTINSKMLAIGAPGMGYENRGKVLIYQRNKDGSFKDQIGQTVSADGAVPNDMFGFDVGSTHDRLYVSAVGRSGQKGTIQVFKEDAHGKFKYSQSIIAPDIDAGSQFAYSFIVSEDFVIVGARNDPLGNQKSADQGSVYVFSNSTGDYKEIMKVVASDGMPGHRFGNAFSCSADTLAINASGAGKNGSGAIYILEQSGK